ncbi:LacI family DNA-binding transcriptional regulator [Rubritalea tangerina]|uniref:LacI family DNA-binding transcriptional regulator n=1 Tax=Rubritalea tangerina TaxID=430798 RepID=A0ABW4Z774_9BACT
MNRIRLSDIAQKAGVSTMAVSHVLNGSGKGKVSVSPALSDHIREVAKQLNYTPHQAARALRGSSIKVIGAISYGAMDPIKTRALACLQTSVERHAFHLMSARITETSSNWEHSIVALLSHGVNALLAFCEDDTHLEQALQLGKQEGVPVIPVRLDGGSIGPSSCGIRTALNSGIQLALDQFSNKHPIKIISDNLPPLWKNHLEQNKLLHTSINKADLIPNDQILTSDDWTAAKLIRLYPNLVPGQDYKIIGWGNAPACDYMTPQLTSIGLNLPEVVNAAVDNITSNQPAMIHNIKPIIIRRQTH